MHRTGWNQRLCKVGLVILIQLAICHTAPAADLAGVTASGSGFFVTSDGYFLTNHHVIRGAGKIRILVGEVTFDAKIVRTDPVNDISLLKAEGEFRVLPLGRSGSVSLGEEVLTIGFPNPDIQGFSPKLTKGEISATTGLHDDQRMFQVSIPIQPGSSGGPLVDESGKVVGIISSTLSALSLLKSEGVVPQNVNYAVKSSYAAALLDGILDNDNENLLNQGPKTRQQIISEVGQAVGLVLVYGSRPQFSPPPAQQPEQRPPQAKPPKQKARRLAGKASDEDIAIMNAVNGQNIERLAYSRFPVEVRELGLRGSGLFRIHFAKDGRATQVRVDRSTGIKRLDEATQRSLLKWRARSGPPFDYVVHMAYTN